MPNWREPTDYLFPSDLRDYFWAWEFLRRNPDYRADWSRALSRYTEKTGEWAASPSDSFESIFREGVILLSNFCEDPSSSEFYLPVDEKENWKLGWGLVNPAIDRPRFLNFAVGYGAVNFVAEGAKTQMKPSGKRYPWAVFDIELPIKPQTDAVLKSLKEFQKRHKIKPHRVKHHRDLWPLYLRLLDAALDARTPKQMADVLKNEVHGLDEKKVWAQLQAARKLTWPTGYLTIFLSSP